MDGALPQRLGIVAYEMEGAPTGVGRYLEGLLSGLAQSRAAITYVLFFRGRAFQHPLWSRAQAVDQHLDATAHGPRFEAVFDDRPTMHPILWEQLRLPWVLRRHRLDALFSPSYSLPPGLRMPTLVTLHDLSFEHLPEEFGFKEGWRRRFLARRAARRASRVLADTGEIRRDLLKTYGLDAAKVGVVPLAVGRRFMMAPKADDPSITARDAEVRRRLGITSPYLLFLGSQLPRRRVDLVIAAFRQLTERQPDLQLVLSGHNALPRPTALDEWIDASGVAARITHLGYVADDALLPLYRGARLTYYLSTYEGYGLPPLESLALGVPSVVSGGLALDDLWPDYPLRIERFTVDEVVRVSSRGLQLASARDELAAEGIERLGRLTWEHCADLFLRQLTTAMERPRA